MGSETKLADRLEIGKEKKRIKLSILHTEGRYKQGVYFKTKGIFLFDENQWTHGNIPNATVIWEDPNYEAVTFDIISTDGILWIWNVWSREEAPIDGRHNGAAMKIDIREDGSRIYRCNDWEPDEDFDDIVFKVEFLTDNL